MSSRAVPMRTPVFQPGAAPGSTPSRSRRACRCESMNRPLIRLNWSTRRGTCRPDRRSGCDGCRGRRRRGGRASRTPARAASGTRRARCRSRPHSLTYLPSFVNFMMRPLASGGGLSFWPLWPSDTKMSPFGAVITSHGSLKRVGTAARHARACQASSGPCPPG